MGDLLDRLETLLRKRAKEMGDAADRAMSRHVEYRHPRGDVTYESENHESTRCRAIGITLEEVADAIREAREVDAHPDTPAR